MGQTNGKEQYGGLDIFRVFAALSAKIRISKIYHSNPHSVML